MNDKIEKLKELIEHYEAKPVSTSMSPTKAELKWMDKKYDLIDELAALEAGEENKMREEWENSKQPDYVPKGCLLYKFHPANNQPKDGAKSVEEILEDNLNESLWTFISTYPVAYKSELMLKDWIIEAMEEYASRRMPSEEEINTWVDNRFEFGKEVAKKLGAKIGIKWAINFINNK